MGKQASTQGDVFSFGVLLLEIITGRRPTDVLFQQGSSLHQWVKGRYPSRLEPIIEQAVDRYAPATMPKHFNRVWVSVILELIELGLMCTQYNPSTRPTMQNVAHEMGRLKDYLSNPSLLLAEEVDPKIEA